MTVVTLRAGDDRVPPIVCPHPITGRTNEYAALVRHLAGDGPVRGLEAFDPPPDGFRFDALVRRYCDDLDLTRPLFLLGWSLGGNIAAELAHVVVARGGQVAFLGVLDSRVPQPEMRGRPTDRDTLWKIYLARAALTRGVDPIAPPPVLDASHMLAALRELGAADDIPDEVELERQLAIFVALGRAFYQHAQAPVPVELELFEAAEFHPSHPRPPTLGWEALAPHIHRHVIAGNHFTLVSPRHAETLAQLLAPRLAAAR